MKIEKLKEIMREAYLENKEWIDSLPNLEEVFDFEELKKSDYFRRNNEKSY